MEKITKKEKVIKEMYEEVGVVAIVEVRDNLFQVSYSSSISSPTKYWEWDGDKMERNSL